MKNKTTTTTIIPLQGLTSQNLRRSVDSSALEVVGLPTKVASQPFRPLCALNGGNIICALGHELYAIAEGAANPTLIAALPAGSEIFCAIAWGERGIVMTTAGAQHIVRQGDEVVCLGTMPSLPTVALSLVESQALTETVAGITLAEPEALRNGALAPADAATLQAALNAAWERLASRARAMGAIFAGEGGGVAVEVRRLDASGAPTASRGAIAVIADANPPAAYAAITTGRIAPFSLTLSALRLSVKVGAPDPEAAATWGEASGEIEITSGAAADPIPSWTFRVEGERLAVATHLDHQSIDLTAPRQSILRVAITGEGDYTVDIPRSVANPAPDVLAPEGFVARTVASSGDVILWGDIDGSRGEVATASASAPLTIASRTVLSLYPIAALAPAPRLGSAALSPGCAHFYAFTSGGILNVSVGAGRTAATASLLDRRGCGSSEQVAVADSAVYALADNGRDIIALRGGRADTILSRPGARWVAAAAEPVSGEVYILDTLGNITALDPSTLTLSARPLPYAPTALIAAAGRLFILADDLLADASRPSASEAVAIAWRGNIPDAKAVRLRGVRIDLDAPDGFNGRIDLRPAAFTPARPGLPQAMTRIAIDGHPSGPLTLRLALPLRAAAEIELTGLASPSARLFGISAILCP